MKDYYQTKETDNKSSHSKLSRLSNEQEKMIEILMDGAEFELEFDTHTDVAMDLRTG